MRVICSRTTLRNAALRDPIVEFLGSFRKVHVVLHGGSKKSMPTSHTLTGSDSAASLAGVSLSFVSISLHFVNI